MAAPAPASCPKCGAPQKAEPACPRCGLAGDRMAAYARAAAAAVPPEVEAAWERVLEAWDDTGRHDALLRVVARHDAYAWTAACYRAAKRAAPASPSPFRSYPDHAVDAIADRQLDRMRRAALATLYASSIARQERVRAPYRAARAILAMLVFAIVAGLVFAMVLRANPQDAPAPVPGEAKPAKPAQPSPRK